MFTDKEIIGANLRHLRLNFVTWKVASGFSKHSRFSTPPFPAAIAVFQLPDSDAFYFASLLFPVF